MNNASHLQLLLFCMNTATTLVRLVGACPCVSRGGPCLARGVYMCRIDLPNDNIMIVCSCYGRRVSVFSDHNNDVMRRDR